MFTAFPKSGIQRLATCIMMAAMILAITFKAVIPAGYMPSQTDSGFFEMVICTGNGEERILVDHNLKPVTHDNSASHSNDKTDSICDFAIQTHYTNTIDQVQATSVIFAYTIAVLPQIPTTINFDYFFGNSASRAPPSFYV